MYKLTIFPHTPIAPDHNKIAPPNFRNMDAPRRLYSPNIKFSSKGKTVQEANQKIKDFFEINGFDLDKIFLDGWEVTGNGS